MSYAGSWSKTFPSGAYKVHDDRLEEFGEGSSRSYFCYDSMREAQMAHAQYVRERRSSRSVGPSRLAPARDWSPGMVLRIT